ncbi:fasciculation and elongation protein zeta-2 [Plakobranchus ocellatus]|uniref:Fasciculation and elongation protein zeta-2 n=1 Tax=Plakobranchus ocellatus TaxID=259542 RepID=A0AAV3Z424_9GAST|nr:fasciculation and elongation protein zeta-2 [Plakobranchus ocellatus]
MRVPKMAELQFEAPLASFENEEWSEYNEFQGANVDTVKPQNIVQSKTDSGEPSEGDEGSQFGETVSGSLEDLVNSFDERITKCFNNLEEQVETFAPVQIRTQEEVVNDCQMWWTITGNFGNILPIDWSKSYTRMLQHRVLNVGEQQEKEAPSLDLSDDEDLAQAFDMHSLIVTSLHPEEEDKVLTAEEVISEIDDMMKQYIGIRLVRLFIVGGLHSMSAVGDHQRVYGGQIKQERRAVLRVIVGGLHSMSAVGDHQRVYGGQIKQERGAVLRVIVGGLHSMSAVGDHQRVYGGQIKQERRAVLRVIVEGLHSMSAIDDHKRVNGGQIKQERRAVLRVIVGGLHSMSAIDDHKRVYGGQIKQERRAVLRVITDDMESEKLGLGSIGRNPQLSHSSHRAADKCTDDMETEELGLGSICRNPQLSHSYHRAADKCEPSAEDYYNAMQETPEDEDYTKVKETTASLAGYDKDELKSMNCTQLNELVAEYDATTKLLSEMLVTELALRDELEFDKELKNQFISLLLTIQKKRRECQSERKNKKKGKNSNTADSTAQNVNTFLTTAIPYHPLQGPPSSEQLQIYIKILQAINEDSSAVPTLLTDYILKGPQQGDLRLLGPPSDRGPDDGAQTRDRRVPTDLRANSQASVPPSPHSVTQQDWQTLPTCLGPVIAKLGKHCCIIAANKGISLTENFSTGKLRRWLNFKSRGLQD